MSDGMCVNCGGVLGREKYRPYCFPCWDACVPELVEARDRLRAALERIAGEFIEMPDGTTRLYSDVKSVLDRVKATAREALR
jgi:hypothetical protein